MAERPWKNDRERAAYYKGVRSCVAWLHARALEMNDPHAKAILNTAGFHLGLDKPLPPPPEG